MTTSFGPSRSRSVAIGVGGLREKVLGVVEHEQHPLAVQHLGHYLAEWPVGLLDDLERPRGMPEHEARVSKGGEWHPPDAVGELVGCLRGSLEREPRLAGAAWPGQRQEADAVPQLLEDFHELALAAEELRGRHGKIREVERSRARELARPQLEEPLCRREILEAVLPEIADGKALVEQVAGRSAEEGLAAVRSRHDPRGPVHVEPDVLRPCDDRLAGVDSGPDPDRAAVQRRQRIPDRARRRRSPWRRRRRTRRPRCPPRSPRAGRTPRARSSGARRGRPDIPPCRDGRAAGSSPRCP